jgi:hypothetical protein
VTASIELAPGAEDNGFANMLSEMIRQNLVDHPHKRRDFDRMLGRVAIVVEDAGVAVTLRFERGRLTVHDGIAGIPDVTVRADADDVTKMSLVELLPVVGLPDPRRPNARAVIEASRAGRIRMYGALGSPMLVVRLTRVMSVA